MGIDIIKRVKKNRLSMKLNDLFWLIFFAMIGLNCSCQSGNSISTKSHKESSYCQLFEDDFEVDSKSFKNFSVYIDDFNLKKHPYDVLSIFMKSGNHQESKLTRYFLSENMKWTQLEVSGNNKNKTLTHDSNDKVQSSLIGGELKSFTQHCTYSTNNDLYMILIRKNGKYIFKYNSVSTNYISLNNLDKDKVKSFIEVLEILDNELK